MQGVLLILLHNLCKSKLCAEGLTYSSSKCSFVFLDHAGLVKLTVGYDKVFLPFQVSLRPLSNACILSYRTVSNVYRTFRLFNFLSYRTESNVGTEVSDKPPSSWHHKGLSEKNKTLKK